LKNLKIFCSNRLFQLQKDFPFFHCRFLPFHVIASLSSCHCESLSFRHCDFSLSRHCEERSDEAISPIAPPRHCEPKGRQVCWREAISQLHIPFSVNCFEKIASPDCHQARNDVKEEMARNDAPFRHCEERSDEAISLLHIPVVVRRSGGIASLTTFARNDGVGLQARNDAIGLFACNGVTKTLFIALQRS